MSKEKNAWLSHRGTLLPPSLHEACRRQRLFVPPEIADRLVAWWRQCSNGRAETRKQRLRRTIAQYVALSAPLQLRRAQEEIIEAEERRQRVAAYLEKQT